ncbi:MAG: ABC transporter ATP-binding protein [Candidatus Marinimicrobia bacterium]|jgi:lipopolysaccharide transport system ATP-binding protein|nr:ABC transporter ATP-binding protein [Candidatus Neomarinimicrobiota bacterium]
MKDVAIKVENLSKRYRIGLKEETKDTLFGAFGSILKSPFQNLKRLKKLTSFNENNNESDDILWALKDISFEVKQGEVLGIIGANGAGKSTLLKILAQITHPTSGKVELHGRVASLLEVGTGFHPELSGRENIYLNGTILGMTKKEIDGKLSEIIDFSGVEKFIDTPVKRYSSGMRVRLAFSVAAHLDPEILLIDEVLAVGDAEFQKKCLGKMDEVAKGGRTVLFVSHNMGVLNNLCENGLLLGNGKKKSHDQMQIVIDRYLNAFINRDSTAEYKFDSGKKVQIMKVDIVNNNYKPTTYLDRMNPLSICVHYDVRESGIKCFICVMIDKLDNTAICHSRDTDSISENNFTRKIGKYKTKITFPGGLLNAGHYKLRVAAAEFNGESYDHLTPFSFELLDLGTFASGSQYGRQRPGILAPLLKWDTVEIDKPNYILD